MKNLGETISIGHGARDEDGTRLEPEEQLVVREFESEADVNVGIDHEGTPTGQSIPLTITAEMPAHEAADIFAKTCSRCAHHRPDLWPAWQRDFDRTKEGREGMNRLRAEILSRGADQIPSMINGLDEEDIHDVEHALSRFGVCVALSEMSGNPIFSLPESTCPEGQEDLFRPRSGARRAVDGIRDRVLHLASKKLR